MRVVTAGSRATKSSGRIQRPDRHGRTRRPVFGSETKASDDKTLHHLHRVETGVIDHPEHRRSTPNVDDAPDQAKRADGNGDIDALVDVQRAEQEREQDEADADAAEPL